MKHITLVVWDDCGLVMAKEIGNCFMKIIWKSLWSIHRYFLLNLIIYSFWLGRTECLASFFSKIPIILYFFSIIRVEIDSSLADYYPEIDAVLLVGTETYPPFEESLKLCVTGLSTKIIGLGLHRLVPGFNAIESIQRLCFKYQVPAQSSTICHFSKLPVRTEFHQVDLVSFYCFI